MITLIFTGELGFFMIVFIPELSGQKNTELNW